MQLCAVTKTHPRSVVDLAAQIGLTVVGENYAGELLEKAQPDDSVAWHYLGAIQRKKVPKLAPVVDLFQGLARVEEAVAIAKVQPQAKVLVQLDTTGLTQRNGVSPDEFADLYEQLFGTGVSVRGVMTVAPPERDAAQRCFQVVRKVADEFHLPICSMGMSGDLQDAVAAGSTMVRVGSALFGPRN